MPGQWQGSDRRDRLPSNWDTEIRPAILKRDSYRCRWIEHNQRCTARATDVDHINRGDDHRPQNLRALCAPHHARKSSAEGNQAKAQRKTLMLRPQRPHPGRRST